MRIVELLKDIIVTDVGELVAYAPGARFWLVRDVSPTMWVLRHLAGKIEFYADPDDFVEIDLQQEPPPLRSS